MFILHNFLARWQDVQFKELLETMLERAMVLCVEFSENYTMRIQNEIQNMHWHNFQISIMVHICYKRNNSYNFAEDELEVIKEVHYYVLDDPMHDTILVQHAFMLH
jgi:hypothetical protein